MARTVLEVFLSSTAADLKSHRDAVYARLVRIEFFKCIRQEDFGAQNAGAVQYCCEKAKAADLFVGMIGLRRGWEPHGDNAKRSITEMEYDCARDAGRGRYLWVSPDDFPVPGNLRESDAEHGRQLAFRKRVMAGGERIVSQKGFASPDVLASEIVEQLLAHVVTGDLIKLLRPELGQAGTAPIQDQKPAIAAAVEKLAEDKDVDLLALAKNPQKVDIDQLEAKLTARAEHHASKGQQENKLSAEYWRHIGALAFLHSTQKALAAYKMATTLDPDEPEGWHNLGQLQLRIGDIAAASKSFDSVITIGRRLGEPQTEAVGHIWKGWILQTQGELAKAEAIATNALRLANLAEWKVGIATTYGNLGEIYRRRGDLRKAEEMQRGALALEEQLGRKDGLARAYGNLGIIYFERDELDKAEQMHRKSLALETELGRKEGMAHDYGNLGLIHQARGDLRRAEQMHQKSLALEKELGRKEGMAADYGNLGLIHQARGDLRRAEQMHQKSLALDEELGNREGTASSLWNLALIHELKGEKKQLCECLQKARDLLREVGLQGDVAEAEAWMKRARCSES